MLRERYHQTPASSCHHSTPSSSTVIPDCSPELPELTVSVSSVSDLIEMFLGNAVRVYWLLKKLVLGYRLTLPHIGFQFKTALKLVKTKRQMCAAAVPLKK